MDVKNIRDSIKRDIQAELKPRKLLRTAFVPQTKGLLSPIKEVFQVFVTLIVQIFVQAKLIPQDHPAAKGEIHGFGAIWLMIIDASKNVKFTRENIYQIIIFYGVVGMLVFGVLDMVAFLMHWSFGQAHAQTVPDSGSLFNETSTSDQAPGWIDSLFPYNGTANANSPGLSSVLGPMLQVYNTALLALGSAFALYQIAHLFLESAHHGKFGGKNYSDLYAPLRLVIGIGLLVPLSSGYNSAEIIAISVAKMGSGLASHVWSTALSGMAQNSTQLSSMPISDINTDLQQLIVDATCTVAYRSDQNDTAAWDWTAMTTDVGNAKIINFGRQDHVGNKYSDSYCGSLTIPKEIYTSSGGTDISGTDFYNALIASGGILDQVHNVADAIYENSSGASDPSAVDSTMNPLSAGCTGACVSAWSTFLATAQGSVITADTTIHDNYVAQVNQTDFSSYSDWTTAGFMFLKLSQQAGKLYQLENPQLGIVLPDSDVMQSATTGKPADCSWYSLSTICSATGKNIATATNLAIKDVNSAASEVGDDPVSFATNTLGGTGGGGKLSSALQGPYATLSAGLLNVACTSGAGCSSTQFGSSIIRIMGLGNLLLNVAGLLIASGALIGLTVAGDIIALILVGLGAALFPLGVSLAIMLPLMPAARFLFGIFTWILTLFEAMVAMPVVALVMIGFNGDGLFAHGKAGWFVLLQMMLRPVLMIFGLIGAFMVFDLLAGFITQSVFGALFNMPNNTNVGDATSVATAMANAARTTILISFLQTVGALYFYAVTLYALANITFQLINRIPDQLLTVWAGLGVNAPPTGDSEGAMQQASQGMSGASTQVGQNVSSGAQALGRTVRANRDAAAADRIAQTRHEQQLITMDRQGYNSGRTPGEIEDDAREENEARDEAGNERGNIL